MNVSAKTLIYLAMVLGMGAAAGSGWGSQVPPAQVLTEQDIGKTVTLRVGEKLALDLRNPASGGYTVGTPVYDERVLKLLSRKNIPPAAATPPKLGDFGRIVFEFAAAAPGETNLSVRISREWEKETPPRDYVKVRVRVVP